MAASQTKNQTNKGGKYLFPRQQIPTPYNKTKPPPLVAALITVQTTEGAE